jgi:hypothetical protein
MDELENCSNHYYHLEEISTDEIDFGKVSELTLTLQCPQAWTFVDRL